MDRQHDDGFAATLRAALVIVIAGVLLGAGFNHLGLVSHPAHGLAWIKRPPARLPSLEDLQPQAPAEPAQRGPASVVPGMRAGERAGAGSPGAVMVLAIATPPIQRVQVAATSASATSTGGVTAAKKKGIAKKKPTVKPAATPATKTAGAPATPATPPAAAPGQAPAKVELPVVPDMDTAIEVKLPFAKKFFDASGAIFVDAREADEYADGHIKGALSVPFDAAAANPDLLKPFKNAGKPLILYCSGGDCELSHDLAKNMLADGIRKVLVFTDGYPAWKAAGYPVETGAPKR